MQFVNRRRFYFSSALGELVREWCLPGCPIRASARVGTNPLLIECRPVYRQLKESPIQRLWLNAEWPPRSTSNCRMFIDHKNLRLFHFVGVSSGLAGSVKSTRTP